MSDTEDIVQQLREWASTICSIRGDATPGRKSQMVRAAADEIERLRTQLEMWQDGNIMAESHSEEIERLRAERDEARREICDKVAAYSPSVTAKQWAMERGWDCFKGDK